MNAPSFYEWMNTPLDATTIVLFYIAGFLSLWLFYRHLRAWARLSDEI